MHSDEQRTTANRYAERGRVALSNGQYDAAIEAYEQALFIIESSPFNIDWKGLRESSQAGLRRARQAKAEYERAGRQAATERSLAEMAEQRERELIQEQQRLEQYMGAAIEAFNRDQFDLAEQYANRILQEQPDNTKAQDLARAATRARHDLGERDFLRKEKLAFREWMDDIAATRVLQEKILKWPSQSFWEQITSVRGQSSRAASLSFSTSARRAASSRSS